jgi:ABC-2 type transport system ATP-binding protein
LTKELAGGWKQRLALGCAILHQPKIVFLDEPTGGVDPISRRNFWELISKLSEEGVTVLVTTHFLDEAEYCNNIILIQAGKLVAEGSPRELKIEHIKNPILEIESDNVVSAMEILQQEKWILGTSIFGTYLHINVQDEEQGKKRILELLKEKGIEVKRMDRIAPSLEDVFIHLIEKQ